MIAIVNLRFFSNGTADATVLQKLDELLSQGFALVAQSHWQVFTHAPGNVILLLHKPGDAPAETYPQCTRCGGHHNPVTGCAFEAEEVHAS